MSDNIGHILSEISSQKGSKTALIEAKTGNSFSFMELERYANGYAHYLHNSGVTTGSRVMLMVKPSVDFICLTFALFKIGAPVILIDPGMGYKNLLRCVSQVKPEYFIGIPKAYLFTKIFRRSFSSLKKRFCCGTSLGLLSNNIAKQRAIHRQPFPTYTPDVDDLAAIIFTTGSTGPPKGVRYEHSIFTAQLELIKKYYRIGPSDIDQPAFPLFALFSTALGACAVIPDMDATKPASVNPASFVRSLIKYQVTYSFGSPALWNVVSHYCLKKSIRLSQLKKVLMAGAPVSGELVGKVKSIIAENGEVHTPYGATECLPIVSIEGEEIIEETWPLTQQGNGTCVGRPLPGIEVKVIRISDSEINEITTKMNVSQGEIGEIIVSGSVVTRSYDGNEVENKLAKVWYQNRLWHRIGDTGYLDSAGRLWFCGRKAHRVKCRGGDKFTIPVEAIINTNPDIFRSALVGVPANDGFEEPAIIIELAKNNDKSQADVLQETKKIALSSPLTADIQYFLFHPSFPVDIRHNAKIFREKLAEWAKERLPSL